MSESNHSAANSRPVLELVPESSQQLAQELSDNLLKGRCFVHTGQRLEQRQLCTLRLIHPQRQAELEIPAEVVWQGPDGLGLSFDAQEHGEVLKSFAEAPAENDDARASGSIRSSSPESGPDGPRNLHERMRGLSLAERDEVARTGSLPERVALERRFGSSVWEGLLHNPTITTREVVRMAKSGSLPTTLVNLITNNRAWLADSAIQNALLSNPRVSGANLDKVLRALPQKELSRVATQNSLRMQVRVAAKRLVRS